MVLNKEMWMEELENHPVMNPETLLALEKKTVMKHQSAKIFNNPIIHIDSHLFHRNFPKKR